MVYDFYHTYVTFSRLRSKTVGDMSVFYIQAVVQVPVLYAHFAHVVVSSGRVGAANTIPFVWWIPMV